jgi:hypothetical protein
VTCALIAPGTDEERLLPWAWFRRDRAALKKGEEPLAGHETAMDARQMVTSRARTLKLGSGVKLSENQLLLDDEGVAQSKIFLSALVGSPVAAV